MCHIELHEIEGKSAGYAALIVLLALVTLAGVLAGHHMDAEGHHVTGMNNRIVWGLPHVFAVFLIVAASGALNVASLSSVFGRTVYEPLARLQALLVLVVLYFAIARHLANLYVAEHAAVERFLLIDGGAYPAIFRIGQILAGSLLPLAILWAILWRRRSLSRGWIAAAASLVILGGLSQLYGIIIGGQAAPLVIFPQAFSCTPFLPCVSDNRRKCSSG